ncbi:hypothetical protein Tco_0300359 [Tanacetum coccineum]
MMSINCLSEASDHASNICHFLSPCIRGTLSLVSRPATSATSYQSLAATSATSIPCSPEYKIVGQILLDHPLSYALTTVDVPFVYLQQFWKTVNKVPDTKDTIRFKLDTQDIVYTVDIFHDTLKLPVETPENPFIAPVNIEVIQSFMQRVGYQGVVDKVSAFFTKFFVQPWQTMFKVFNRCLITRTSGHDQTKINILQLFHDVDNHAFLTEEIRATNDYKEYETVFVNVVVPMNQPQMVVNGEKDEESYADKFASSMLHDDVDDFRDRIKPGSHKEHLEVVDDDDENKEEKKDDEMGKLTDTVSPSTTTTSKDPHKKRCISSKYSHLPGALHGMCRHQGYMIRDMERKCVTTDEFSKVPRKVDQVLHEIVPQLAEKATNDLIEGNLKRVVADTIIQER